MDRKGEGGTSGRRAPVPRRQRENKNETRLRRKKEEKNLRLSLSSIFFFESVFFHLLYNKVKQEKKAKRRDANQDKRKGKKRKAREGERERKKRHLSPPPLPTFHPLFFSLSPPPLSLSLSLSSLSPGPDLGDVVVLRQRSQVRVEGRHAVPVALRGELRHALGLPRRDGLVVAALGVGPPVDGL